MSDLIELSGDVPTDVLDALMTLTAGWGEEKKDDAFWRCVERVWFRTINPYRDANIARLSSIKDWVYAGPFSKTTVPLVVEMSTLTMDQLNDLAERWGVGLQKVVIHCIRWVFEDCRKRDAAA